MRQVAAAAGVSMSTVSNVLNNPHRVLASTRRRVEEAMDQVGYVRNSAARQLRGARSRVIGCIMPNTANPFYAALARGMEDRLAEAGCVLIQCSTDAQSEREARYLQILQEQDVGGIMISPVSVGLERLLTVRGRGTPIVLLDRERDHTDLCAASVDNVVAASWPLNTCSASATGGWPTYARRRRCPASVTAPRASTRPCGPPAWTRPPP
ncbi:LacI family DNA-binding transcriptional regulator [Streptomyces sp. B6B3]|uniref:LacI family DNA-binding transcriptional regulator n=1 Tax=Streptomyces sp. B6B3 TaxID=3153570 RepID=UPI00325EA0F6